MAQAKGTSIKEALAKLEEKEECKASEMEKVKLFAQIPPIEKMDASVSALQKCNHLALSTNNIEKIANLNGLKNLKILSLGRNNIKSLTGLEVVGDTLTELWISYNQIDKLRGINVLKKLKVLFMIHNKVGDTNEFNKLAELPYLENLSFHGNPLADRLKAEESEAGYRKFVQNKLKRIKVLDSVTVIREDDDDDIQLQQQQQ